MLRRDSVHGTFAGKVKVEGSTLMVNGRQIHLSAVKDPAELRWNEVGAEIVVESTGLFLTPESCEKHLAAGARKVIQSAPSKNDMPMFRGATIPLAADVVVGKKLHAAEPAVVKDAGAVVTRRR